MLRLCDEHFTNPTPIGACDYIPSALIALARDPEEARPVRTNRTAWKRRLIGPFSSVILIAAGLSGCGRSAEPIRIPEVAKTFLFKKKADYEHRSPKAIRSGPSTAKNPTKNSRP